MGLKALPTFELLLLVTIFTRLGSAEVAGHTGPGLVPEIGVGQNHPDSDTDSTLKAALTQYVTQQEILVTDTGNADNSYYIGVINGWVSQRDATNLFLLLAELSKNDRYRKLALEIEAKLPLPKPGETVIVKGHLTLPEGPYTVTKVGKNGAIRVKNGAFNSTYVGKSEYVNSVKQFGNLKQGGSVIVKGHKDLKDGSYSIHTVGDTGEVLVHKDLTSLTLIPKSQRIPTVKKYGKIKPDNSVTLSGHESLKDGNYVVHKVGENGDIVVRAGWGVYVYVPKSKYVD